MIDFDEASKQWRMNKKTDKYTPGVFTYVCGVIKKNGLPCRAPPRTFIKKFRGDFKYTWSKCNFQWGV